MSDYRFVINRQARNLNNAVVRSATDLNPVPIKQLVIGDGRTTRVEIVSDGDLDPVSGDATYGLIVAIGTPCDFPAGGTYKVADEDPSETGPIDFDADDADFIAALESLATIGAGNVQMRGFKAGQFYEVEFVGDLADQQVTGLSIVDNQLTPLSSVSIQSTQVGGGGQNERKLFRLRAAPAVLQADWAPDGQGWDGILSANTLQALLALAAQSPFVGTLEVRLVHPDGRLETLAQAQDVLIVCDVADVATFVSATYPELAWADLRNVRQPDGRQNMFPVTNIVMDDDLELGRDAPAYLMLDPDGADRTVDWVGTLGNAYSQVVKHTGTANSITLERDGTPFITLFAKESVAWIVDENGDVRILAVDTNTPQASQQIATGSPYVITTTEATVTFGTTDPTLTLARRGTYLITVNHDLFCDDATGTGGLGLRLRRLNNTPADLPNSFGGHEYLGGLSNTDGNLPPNLVPQVIYQTNTDGDEIALRAILSSALSSGTIEVRSARITAQRISD